MPEMLGAIFAVVLMAFAYVLLSFSLEVTSSQGFPKLADKVVRGEISLLPVTVIVAILLFIVKEVLELFKKGRESKRKLFAYMSLISEELELNLWALKRLLKIVTDIENQEEDHPNANYTLLIKESGQEYIHGYDGDDLIESCSIPIVHDKYYEKFIASIAELDANLFNLAQWSYEEVRNMGHVRTGLIKALLAEENNEPFPHDLRKSGFLDYAKSELADTFTAMNALYKECTGNELQQHRIR
ncbi:hypothetical protein BTJ40_06325 [Microbulbifer sp. A4B17]|uniref:hypothetical protein n=1 Tax=Microbulbifer sp. A4B17 TaxID=359370 RepID=UPI000D52E208|nr:hypothetical protein [Microbulbifer sp. A4B17]AWF80459.1 hypothetical protein BTJ40_06325 [Microbulbifer sp. A4B17]